MKTREKTARRRHTFCDESIGRRLAAVMFESMPVHAAKRGLPVLLGILITATLGVRSADAATCSPVACDQIKVALPYSLGFSSDAGRAQDDVGIGTGFTYIAPKGTASGYVPAKLHVDMTAGQLKVTTTSGIAYQANNTQDNALSVGIDAPSQITRIRTTLVNIPAGTGKSEQGGLWFGTDQDNYVKLTVLSTTSGNVIEYAYEELGALKRKQRTAVINTSNATIELSLKADPSNTSIAAFYKLNGGAEQPVATYTVSPELFSFDGAGIDPSIGTRSFGGIFGSNRNSVTPVVYSFDDFSVTSDGSATPPPPPPTSDVQFRKVSFPVRNPTSMVWGPDNSLYVTEVGGAIHRITLDANKAVTSNTVITTLGNRLALGITVDPASSASNVVLWVAHSDPSQNNGTPNSSMVTRLSGPGFTIRDDVITGLPRAIANHSTNAIHFGPDGKLYIAQGGNTGAGAPNTSNSEFGDMQEQPLSAALLVADVKAVGFNGSCNNPTDIFGPPPCSVQVFASGLRNTYDFVFHSNGKIYGPDNGLGVTGTYPPNPAPPCFGFGSTASYTNGGNNPGTQPDVLNLLEAGKYYGHPDPYRNQCVFNDGHYQKVAPLANYTPPIYNLGDHKSADGTIEYTSDAFGGRLKGEILLANYSVGDDITRIKLSADGRSVVSAESLIGGFNNPLPLAQGPDGTIYVGELGAGRVTALIPDGIATPPPDTLGTWTTEQPMPAATLDAGGAALGGRLYAVAGKNATTHLSTVGVFDPVTKAWGSVANLPGPAVENPAVVSYNNKLYVFGGSTGPFSGAVNNSAVYDPATGVWTPLAPMPTPRGGPTAQMINGYIYVAGGMSGTGASLTTVEIYNPYTNSWSTAAPMSTPRDNPGSAALNGKLYVFGGRYRLANGTEVTPSLNTVEAYEEATNTWAAKAAMPTGRRTMAVGTLRGRAQLSGGERQTDGSTFPQNEEYDPMTDTWLTLTPMKTPRHGAAFGTIGTVFYVAGGGTTGGTSFSSITEGFAFPSATPTPTPTPAPTATPTPTPTATPTPSPTGPRLSGMTVMTASGSVSVVRGPFADGYVYDLKDGSSVRADPVSGVASVVFKLDGTVIRTENIAPYSVAGDSNGVYTTWKPAVGSHTLVATPYSATGGGGTAGAGISVSFTVVNTASSPTPTATPTPTPTATPTPTPAPDYSLSISPSSNKVGRNGGTAIYTVTVNPTNGFDSPVTFSVSGLPSGTTGTFSPSPSTTTSTLTLTVNASTNKGNYTFTVTGAGGSPTITRTVTASLNKTKGR